MRTVGRLLLAIATVVGAVVLLCLLYGGPGPSS